MTDVRLTATNPDDSSVVPVACNARGELRLEEIPDQSFDGNLQGDLTVSGRVISAGNVDAGDLSEGSGSRLGNTGSYVARRNDFDTPNQISLNAGVRGDNWTIVAFPTGTSNISFGVKTNGAATFANGNAGFTAEGYLWCTTRRGDTVILDATSNGLASWVPYTPPNRLTELQDKWAEKDGILPVPHDSSQDEPETTQ